VQGFKESTIQENGQIALAVRGVCDRLRSVRQQFVTVDIGGSASASQGGRRSNMKAQLTLRSASSMHREDAIEDLANARLTLSQMRFQGGEVRYISGAREQREQSGTRGGRIERPC
jgi:hypothetical protein